MNTGVLKGLGVVALFMGVLALFGMTQQSNARCYEHGDGRVGALMFGQAPGGGFTFATLFDADPDAENGGPWEVSDLRYDNIDAAISAGHQRMLAEGFAQVQCPRDESDDLFILIPAWSAIL